MATPDLFSSGAGAPSYDRLLEDGKHALYQQSDTPKIDAEVLLQHVVQRPLAWLISHGDKPASIEHIKRYYALIAERQRGQPVAYLTGEKEFWSLTLKVDSRVLVPRPDTETLVEQALARLTPTQTTQVLDLGTGSGAIALAIAKERPLAEVIAVDSSEEALDLATENARRNHVDNVAFLHSDWFAEVPAHMRFDLIASNPPYVHAEDPHLSEPDLRFEPAVALVGGGDGLDDIRMIVNNTPDFLQSGGWLLIEHGYDQAAAVVALYSSRGFQRIETYQDLNGQPRCTVGCWQ